MSAPTPPTTVPPIQAVLSDVIAQLVIIAYAYLTPQAEVVEADLASAEIAIDVAAQTFDRIQAKLSSEERAALARMLTELRMTFVRKQSA
jgi:hypothetical protein